MKCGYKRSGKKAPAELSSVSVFPYDQTKYHKVYITGVNVEAAPGKAPVSADKIYKSCLYFSDNLKTLDFAPVQAYDKSMGKREQFAERSIIWWNQV